MDPSEGLGVGYQPLDVLQICISIGQDRRHVYILKWPRIKQKVVGLKGTATKQDDPIQSELSKVTKQGFFTTQATSEQFVVLVDFALLYSQINPGF